MFKYIERKKEVVHGLQIQRRNMRYHKKDGNKSYYQETDEKISALS